LSQISAIGNLLAVQARWREAFGIWRRRWIAFSSSRVSSTGRAGESFSPEIHVKTRRQTFPCLFAKQLAQAVLRNEIEEISTIAARRASQRDRFASACFYR